MGKQNIKLGGETLNSLVDWLKCVSADQVWDEHQVTFAGMNEISSGYPKKQERGTCLMVSFGCCRQNVLHRNV